MPYVNNPSVPSLASSVDPSVKSAIQYITNYLTKFNNTLGTSLGNYSTGSTGTRVTSIPDGSIPESKLTINLNKRIDLIDTPDVGLVDSLFRLEVLQPTVFIQELEPTAIALSDIWVHPVSLVSKRWSGAEWLAISPQPNIELISVEPPMSPAQGDIWIKIVDEDLKQYTWYTWLTDQWQPYDPASALYINSIATNANTTNIAAVTAINNVSATSDSANARALYTTKSAVEHPTTGLTSKASITDLSTANSTLATAVASSIVQTSTTLNGQTSTIEAMAESVDGVKAQYTVKLNANDKVAGFGLMLDDGEPSVFEVVADKFAIVHSDGVNSTSPFTVSGGNTYIQNALIQNAAIDTLKIAGNAVSFSDATSVVGAITLPYGKGKSVKLVDLNTDGYADCRILIVATFSYWYIRNNYDSQPYHTLSNITLRINSVTVGNYTAVSYIEGNFAISYIHTPTTDGNINIDIWAANALRQGDVYDMYGYYSDIVLSALVLRR